MIKLLITILLSFSFPASNLMADESLEKVDQYMQAWHKARQFNGTVLIAKGGEIVFEKGYGLANMSWKAANAPDTRFDIGSIAKQFTAVLVFQLCEQKRINLEDPIINYFENIGPETYGKVTVDHLLQQTSGIPCILNDQKMLPGGYESTMIMWHHYTTDEILRNIFSKDLFFEPGSEYRYSNSNYFLLKEIVEKVTGNTYEELIRNNIAEPLKLEGTGVIRHEVVIPKMATGYQVIGEEFGIAPYDFDPNYYGAAGMYSTARDLLKWNLALRSGLLLSNEWQQKLFTPYITENNTEYAYSQTLYKRRLPDFDGAVSFYSFNGAPKGFMSDVYLFPKTGHIIILLDNTQEYHHWAIGPGLYALLNQKPVRFPLPPAADVITAYVMNNPVDKAMVEYERLKNLADQYDFSAVESEINKYGYRLMNQGRMALALRTFKLNESLFPFSANALDSLGDYYIRANDQEMAESYFVRKQVIREQAGKLNSLLRNEQYDELAEEISSLRKSLPQASLFSDRVIGPLFGQAMGSDPQKAIKIAHIWISGNPADAGPLFSLAAAYQRSGEKDKAIACYREIIEKFADTRFQKSAEDRLGKLIQ